MAPRQIDKFLTAFLVSFFTSLRKDSVANYASIWTLFSPAVRRFGVLYNALNVSQFHRQVAPQDSQICGRNFPQCKNLAAELCQILCIVTMYILINSTHIYQHMRMTISCQYCIAFEVMLLFLVLILVLVLVLRIWFVYITGTQPTSIFISPNIFTTFALPGRESIFQIPTLKIHPFCRLWTFTNTTLCLCKALCCSWSGVPTSCLLQAYGSANGVVPILLVRLAMFLNFVAVGGTGIVLTAPSVWMPQPINKTQSMQPPVLYGMPFLLHPPNLSGLAMVQGTAGK